MVKIQEGDEPDERPEDLFAELHEATLQLEELIYRINRTNLQATHEVCLSQNDSKERRFDYGSNSLAERVFKVAGGKRIEI